MGKSGPICLPTSSHPGQSGGEVTGLPMQQDHSGRSRVVQHALVLGSSVNVVHKLKIGKILRFACPNLGS